MARHFTELVCWQLARELQREIFEVTSRHAFRANLRLRDQLRDAASSVRRNIAEGFGRRGHREFARFLNVSLASLKEVEDELIESVDNRYLKDQDVQTARRLCKRSTVAISRLRNSIKDRPDPPWY